jgi:hypothetical protein
MELAPSPLQQEMLSNIPGDWFQGSNKLFIRQEIQLADAVGLNGQQRYRVSIPTASGEEGEVFMYLSEEGGGAANFCVRCCFGNNRALKIRLHNGPNSDSPILMEMSKPFHCGGHVPCWRANMTITDVEAGKNEYLGRIFDPCICCAYKHQIFDRDEKEIYNQYASCMTSFCGQFACCNTFPFTTKRGAEEVGSVTKQKLDLQECWAGNVRAIIDFGQNTDVVERKILLAGAMFADMTVWEKKE